MSPYARARSLSGRIARAFTKAKYYGRIYRAAVLASRLNRVYRWMIEHPHRNSTLA